MKYIATISIFELNEQFKPDKLQSQFKEYFDDFPTNDSLEVKMETAKNIASKRLDKDLISSLFFIIKIRTNDIQNTSVFQNRDYFEPIPSKRCYFKWTWDNEKNTMVGTTLFADEQN